MNMRIDIFFLALFCLIFQPTAQPLPLVFQTPPAAAAAPELSLVSAAVCENIKDFLPQQPAIVFSFTIGNVSCFSAFDPVPQKTSIYHNWYYRDKLISKKSLALMTPRWSTYSSIQLRESDIGPWRVVITDQQDRVFRVLRFSITE